VTASTRRLALGAALVIVAAAGVAWVVFRTPRTLVRERCDGCNVLLITIDTLRADRVGAFGGTRRLTPTLDRLAGEGIRLTRAYASAPLTLPSHASLMTAASPPVHGVRNNSLFRLGDKLPTLATVLKSAGYRTGAFVGAFVLDARFGLNRGFDFYDDRYGEQASGDPGEGPERRAEDVVRPAAAWIVNPQSVNPQSVNPQSVNPQSSINPQSAIRNPQSPWFAWVHLFDPHAPYSAPEPYASQHEPYDAEVAYTDAMVGRLLDDLRAAGLLDRTLIVLTADHGESLGEHGETTHGVFVYDVTMRVPALLWAGSRIGSGAYGGVARIIDLAPTVLELVGVAVPSTFEGRSLLPWLKDPVTEPVSAYLEAMDAQLTRNWAPLTGLVAGPFKLIDLPVPELYDLAADPGEATNLFARNPERARALEALLRDRVAQLAARGSTEERIALDADARQRLQALGYATGAADPGKRVYTDADDPKRLIGPANDLDRALAAFRQGAPDRGMAAVREIMRSHPRFTTAFGIYASMQRDTGDLAGAVATLEDLVRRGIADQSMMVVLAGYLQEAGALDRSAKLLEAVIAAHPDYAEAYNSLGVVYSRLGRHADARAAFRKVIALDPTSAKAYENLGIDAIGAGDTAAAVSALKEALAIDPGLSAAHNALATVYLRQGRESDAIAEWKTALQLNPRLFDAIYNLGMVLDKAGRRDEARPYLERFVNEAPRGRYGADIARLQALLGR
jgi:arylsulfatase A-like enzyme/Tfp pilus assembly protein PilF